LAKDCGILGSQQIGIRPATPRRNGKAEPFVLTLDQE
jgi:hypothetical protein